MRGKFWLSEKIDAFKKAKYKQRLAKGEKPQEAKLKQALKSWAQLDVHMRK